MINVLSHLFLPRSSNNYRSSLLHLKIIFSFILFFLLSGLTMFFAKENFPSVLAASSNISSQQLVIFTNEKRQENGKPSLVLNDKLSQAAANKATDMFSKDYWAHNSPDGTTPWVFIKKSGYDYIYAGENLAKGFNNASDVVNAWMNSPEHRQNMLSANYHDVGFAVVEGKLGGEDTILVVEMFGSNSNLSTKAIASDITKVQILQKPEVQTNVQLLTPTPSISGVISPKGLVISAASRSTPLVDSKKFSLAFGNIFLSLFIFILILDMLIIEKKKIVRFVGHNLDHVIFLSLIFFIIMVVFKGSVI